MKGASPKRPMSVFSVTKAMQQGDTLRSSGRGKPGWARPGRAPVVDFRGQTELGDLETGSLNQPRPRNACEDVQVTGDMSNSAPIAHAGRAQARLRTNAGPLATRRDIFKSLVKRTGYVISSYTYKQNQQGCKMPWSTWDCTLARCSRILNSIMMTRV